MQQIRYLSLFSGIGGFELGIQQAYDNRPHIRNRIEDIPEDMSDTQESSDGLTCIGYSEIDKYAAKVYQHHFPTHHNYGDITTINADELPDFDLLVGGFPCQSFSIAGKRRGFEDTRGTLFFDIARILKTKHPKLLLLENVKGLLSHDGGNTFKTIISTLDELGYDLQWQVLNSKNHGVPQNRERIFIIGHLRGTSRPEVFPFIEGNGAAIKKLGNKNPSGHGQSGQVVSIDGLHPTIGAGGGNPNRKRDIGWSSGYIQQLNSPTHSNDRVYGEDGISPTLNTMQGGNRQPFVAVMRGRNPENSSDRTVGAPTEQRLEVNQNGTSNTLTSVGKDNLVLESMKIRRLTPQECERLQGFPEIEKYAILQVCKDIQNNSVSVEVLNPKLQKLVGIVEKKDLQETVLSAEKDLHSNYPQTDKLAQVDVLINCEENGVEILSQGKSLLNAKYAEKKNWSHQYIKIEDFAHLLVGLNTMSERITKRGEEELLQSEQSLTPQKSGLKLGKLYGNEIMLPVGDAENDLTTLKELLKFTTSNHSDTENLEQRLLILSSFVIRAINGYIPKEILNQDTFTIGIRTRLGWTAVENTSDSQRYKMCGNAVTVNVIRDIMEKLL